MMKIKNFLNWFGRMLKVKTTNGIPSTKSAPKWATGLVQFDSGSWFWLERDGSKFTNDSDSYYPQSGKIEFTGYVSESKTPFNVCYV